SIQFENSKKENQQFFEQLKQLRYLENLSLEMFYNQQILDSLSDFIRNNQSLKNLQLVKIVQFNQYNLDIKQICEAIQNHKNIIQVIFSFKNEQNEIVQKENESIWQNEKIQKFYAPIANCIQNCQNSLNVVELYEDKINEEGISLILKQVENNDKTMYLRFKSCLNNQVNQCSEVFQQQYYQCCLKGKIIKTYFYMPNCIYSIYKS
ncbi:telomerase component p95, putative, partial [Ichthyophthirius multifiliis]